MTQFLMPNGNTIAVQLILDEINANISSNSTGAIFQNKVQFEQLLSHSSSVFRSTTPLAIIVPKSKFNIDQTKSLMARYAQRLNLGPDTFKVIESHIYVNDPIQPKENKSKSVEVLIIQTSPCIITQSALNATVDLK